MKKRFIVCALLALFFARPVLAGDTYTFNGNGNWTDPANWVGGRVAPSIIEGDMYGHVDVFVTGTATLNTNVTIAEEVVNMTTFQAYSGFLHVTGSLKILNGFSLTFNSSTTSYHSGNIEIMAGGSLNVNSSGWVDFSGNVTVHGTIRNAGVWHHSSILPITVYGQFTNTGILFGGTRIAVKSGGTFTNTRNIAIGSIILEEGGVFVNSGKLNGSGVINGRLTNSGTLTPGNSPGTIQVGESYSATSTAIHNFEVGGMSSGSYDKLEVTGAVALNGTLNVTLINGFTPTTSHEIPIITGTISGTFSTVNIPSSYALVYNANSVVLRSLAVLPVNFESLDAKVEGNGRRINWKVANELNVDRYDVEKSLNGSSFVKIGDVKASTQTKYSFKDESPDQAVYYRIKAVDTDGKYKYSSIVKSNKNKSEVVVRVFPQPASSTVTIEHPSGTNSTIRVYSAEGKLIKTATCSANAQQTTIDISMFKSGIYFLQYADVKYQGEMIKLLK